MLAQRALTQQTDTDLCLINNLKTPKQLTRPRANRFEDSAALALQVSQLGNSEHVHLSEIFAVKHINVLSLNRNFRATKRSEKN